MSNKEEIEKAKRICRLLCGKKNKKGKREYETFTRLQMQIDYTVDEMAEAIETLLQYIDQLEQINNEMAEYLAIVRDCPNEDKGANLDCENRCSDDDSIYAECWKLYFEKKVEELDDKNT